MDGLVAEVLRCGVQYGKFEGLVSVERWSCSRGASCVGSTPWEGWGTGLCREVVL